MAYLGRKGAVAPLTSGDIPDGVIEGRDIAFFENASGQDLSGTYSTERMYLAGRTGSAPNDYNYKLVGNIDVTGHLALGSIADGDVIITQDSTERTITGSGTLDSGNVLQDTHRTSLTDMTGELGSAVTGSPNIILSTTKFSDGSEGVKTNANGYVTKPNIPAFSIRNSSTMQLASGGANEIMKFDSITSGGGGGVNNGGHFNLTNYHFYPPIAGLYYFNVCLTFASSGITGRYCRGRIVKNGSVILVNAHNHVSDESGNDDYHGVAGTCITPLVVGDYIYVHVAEVTADTYLPDNMSNFVGWLLG